MTASTIPIGHGARLRCTGSGERGEWNRFVADSPTGHFFHSWEWGEVKEGAGWRAIRCLIEDGEGPIAALPLLKPARTLFGRCLLYCPAGPAFAARRDPELALLRPLLESLCRKEGAVFLKIDPKVAPDDVPSLERLRDLGFRPAPRGSTHLGLADSPVTLLLDLTPSLDEIRRRMADKHRQYLARFERAGGRVRDAETEEDLERFIQLAGRTSERGGFLLHPPGYYRRCWDVLLRGDHGDASSPSARLLLAEIDGSTVAGRAAVRFGRRAYDFWAASGDERRDLRPNHALVWRLLQWAKSAGCEEYDFRGAGVASEERPEGKTVGIYRFKKGFGPRFVRYAGELDLVASPLLYRAWLQAIPMVHRHLGRIVRWVEGR